MVDVYELRVHGVSGTPVEAVLNDPHPEQVAGDDSGRIYTRREAIKSRLYRNAARKVEAYHWGRYTSGSATRALWLLLLPFALINIARFAQLMPRRRRTRDRVADAAIRLLGLALTIMLIVTACYVAWELAARQCAAAGCVSDTWWLRWFGNRSYGVRFLVAAIVPVVTLALVWTFGRQSFTYGLPGPPRLWQKTKKGNHDTNGSFDDVGFWRGSAQSAIQRVAHVTVACAVIGTLALCALGGPWDWWDVAPWWLQVLYPVAWPVIVAGGFAGLIIVIGDPKPDLTQLKAEKSGREPIELRELHWLRRGMAIAAAGCVVLATFGLDITLPRPRGRNAAYDVAVNGTALLAAGLLLVIAGMCAVLAFVGEPGRRLREGNTQRGKYPTVPSAFRPYWCGFGAWVLATLGTLIGFGFSTAFVLWTADALGTPVADTAASASTVVREQQIEIAATYWITSAIWGVLAAVLASSLLPLAAWMLRRRFVWVLLLTAAAVAIAAWGSLDYEGSNMLSDQAEWYLWAALPALGAALLCVVDRSDGIRQLVNRDYSGAHSAHILRGAARVAKRWRIALTRYRYHHAVGLLALLGAVAILASSALGLITLGTVPLFSGHLPATPAIVTDLAASAWNDVGVAILSAMAAGLITLGALTWKQPGMRRAVGIAWDMLSFWPRVGHPLCPPPYGDRAVLAVADRCSQLVNAKKASAVVLSAHSQGAVISLAACAVIGQRSREGQTTDDPDDWLTRSKAKQTLEKLNLITYGSQLQFIYSRLFPTYMGYFRLHWIYDKDLVGHRWRSFYRWTDPLGGPVLSWPHDTASKHRHGPAVDSWSFISCAKEKPCPGHSPVPVDLSEVKNRIEHGYWEIGSDIRLKDPSIVVDNPHRPRLPARGHSDYPSDPIFDMVMARLVDGTLPSPPDCPGVETTTGVAHPPESPRVDTSVG